MSFTAMTSNNELINLLDIENFDNKGEYFCKVCKNKMVYVSGYFIGDSFWRSHFRHYIKCVFETESESKEHMEMKEFLYRELKKWNITKDIGIERKIGKRITDIFLITSSDEKIAIECQASSITQKEFLERCRDFNNENIFILWIFYRGRNFLKSFYIDKYAGFDGERGEFYEAKRNRSKITQIERLAHKIYFGRIYYYEPSKILSVHFITAKRKRWGSFGARDIKSLKIMTAVNKFDGTKIGRFFDKAWWKNES